MYALAATLDPDTYRTPGDGDVRRDGSWPATRASASSTTSTTNPAGRRTPTRTRWARRLLRAAERPASASPCSTPATCTAASASPRTPCSGASATARPRRGPSASTALADGASPRARLGAAVHSVRAVDPRGDRRRRGAGPRERGAVLHAHVSEQPAENTDCLAAHGCTPVELLARTPALDERFTAVHATHLDVARHRAARRRPAPCAASARPPSATWPTESDRRRPSRAGVRLCLGSDSHAVIDLFEEARAVELDERLASGRRGTHDPSALLRAATVGGLPRPRLAMAARSRPAASPTS